MGWDISENEFIFAKDGTTSSPGEVYTPAATGYANTHIGQQLKIGNGQEEDTFIVFDGNATDIRMGIDDSSDLFEIGTGTAHDTTAAITINTSQVVNFPNNPQFGGTAIGATAAELNLLDGSAKSTSSITLADADGFIVIDGTTTKQIPWQEVISKLRHLGVLLGGTGWFWRLYRTITIYNRYGPGLFRGANKIVNFGWRNTEIRGNTTGVHVTSLAETSSRELKTNITPLNNSLDKLWYFKVSTLSGKMSLKVNKSEF